MIVKGGPSLEPTLSLPHPPSEPDVEELIENLEPGTLTSLT